MNIKLHRQERENVDFSIMEIFKTVNLSRYSSSFLDIGPRNPRLYEILELGISLLTITPPFFTGLWLSHFTGYSNIVWTIWKPFDPIIE